MVDQVFTGELPKHKYNIANYGELEASRHITRLDIEPKPGSKRQTHGWQVRYQKKTKYFGDNNGSPRDSLDKAEAYLKSIYQGYTPMLRGMEGPHKRLKLDIPGVRVTTLKKSAHRLANGEKRTSGVLQVYVEANHPFKGIKSQRFYVGTTETCTDEKMEQCMQKAIAFRKAAERDFKSFRAVVPPWSPNNTVEYFLEFCRKSSEEDMSAPA